MAVSENQLDFIKTISKNTLVENLGIEITEVGVGRVCGKMPVDKRTIQPMGLLHGGASVALAETLGSIGSLTLIDPKKFAAVGIDINASHLKSAKNGWVFGEAICIKQGRNVHFWEIKIKDVDNNLLCVSKLTVSIIPLKSDAE